LIYEFVFVAAALTAGLGAGPSVMRGRMSKIVGEEDQGSYMFSLENIFCPMLKFCYAILKI